MDDATLYQLLSTVLPALVVLYALIGLVRLLSRSRPDLDILSPVIVGLGLRWIVILGVSATGLTNTLRGGDELRFLASAQDVAATSFLSDSWQVNEHLRLHELFFALQIKAFDASELALRVSQTGLAMAGVVLIAVAVHDVAGPRASRLAGWLIALEPANIFFSSILHREPLLMFAAGLVVIGGVRLWQRLDLRGLLLMGAGCLLAVGTRPYAGWFLVAAVVALALHASLRHLVGRLRSLAVLYAAVIGVLLAAPAVLQQTSDSKLAKLQTSQNANTNPGVAGPSIAPVANSNNLALEEVDYSSSSAILTNLPRRIRDLLLRPYPWQLGTINQIVGVAGSLAALVCFWLLGKALLAGKRLLRRDLAPIAYPLLFLLVAYALSVGNAGTGFRYRTHLVMLALGILAIMVSRREAISSAADKSQPGPAGLAAGVSPLPGLQSVSPLRGVSPGARVSS